MFASRQAAWEHVRCSPKPHLDRSERPVELVALVCPVFTLDRHHPLDAEFASHEFEVEKLGCTETDVLVVAQLAEGGKSTPSIYEHPALHV
ncbi:MAG: hypothetical protein WKH64_18320 [Chloroflexia bacterium]